MKMSRDEHKEWQAIVGAVREAVGDSVDLLIEAHDRFGVGTAVEIG